MPQLEPADGESKLLLKPTILLQCPCVFSSAEDVHLWLHLPRIEELSEYGYPELSWICPDSSPAEEMSGVPPFKILKDKTEAIKQHEMVHSVLNCPLLGFLI